MLCGLEYIGAILGLYWDNVEENGNYYNGVCMCIYRGSIRIMEKKMETTSSVLCPYQAMPGKSRTPRSCGTSGVRSPKRLYYVV